MLLVRWERLVLGVGDSLGKCHLAVGGGKVPFLAVEGEEKTLVQRRPKPRAREIGGKPG